MAEYTQRPLFPITCGDVGETAKEVENNLKQNFDLAHRWGCVLLLDEADVFLQARDKEDMRRNSVVSVFLRVLEYYSGECFIVLNDLSCKISNLLLSDSSSQAYGSQTVLSGLSHSLLSPRP